MTTEPKSALDAVEGIVIAICSFGFLAFMFFPEAIIEFVKAIRGNGRCKKDHHASCPMCGFKFNDR